mmetsp:Transcript_22496/g.47636  ORF Transcript_22496/g.47636 Transcript_22496/m.47636 type:complete len:403 (+) Transcript_22496:14-1222(+)|eukprot:CAMPEP_0195566338 /NCGR_PEP_ID=MMETSP0814-20130614/1011_1 /TAXON_ID=97485 /ORGANISM="Prymnesium parvum, Strain Texoma1" /LENGTH=402 /DNA_ID=CAMNT_0040701453 /DNA_START=11 /DNA_END=1219 /DNA_ORIENTATION=+
MASKVVRVHQQPFSVHFHPTKQLFAVGLINGQIKVYDFAGDAPCKASSARPHADACRAVRFSPAGTGLFSAGSDCSLQLRDLESNKPAWRKKGAHETPINAIVELEEIGVGSGDDSGVVKLWDLRTRKLALQFQENTDFIADMLYTQHKGNTLAVASGDGCLSVFDLRAGRLFARSDPLDDELLSLALLKGGRKLICGCQSGTVGIFSWGDFGDVSDRLLGHPESVDAIVPISDDVILTGSSDGMIRVVGVHPNKVLGLVGDHEDLPVEELAIDSGKTTLASCSHDNTVRLWDVEYLQGLKFTSKGLVADTNSDCDDDESSGDEDSDAEPDAGAASTEEKSESQRLPHGKRKLTSGDQGNHEPASSSVDDGHVETPVERKAPRQLVNKNAAIKMPSDFFGDL